jgi:hypothetical protein
MIATALLAATMLTAGLAAGPTAAPAVAATPAPVAPESQVATTPVEAQKPYLGWSSWSLESTNYPGVNTSGPASWLTEAHVLQQADVVAKKLKSHGYQYINIDAGWQKGFDAFGRPVANPTTFPDGIAHVSDYVHRSGLKLGIYLAVGLDPKAYGTGDTPVHGAADCHTRDLVYPDLRTTNGWNSAYKIDYANPCAQAYIDSIADEFAGWGVDFLKLDGVGPGSFQGDANHDDTADVAAWSAALRRTGRPIQFVISWALSHNQADVWKANTNGWRIDTDVECYCDTLVTWNNSVKERWDDVIPWLGDAAPGHWNNLDSLDVGNGLMDGLTDAERQSYTTFWAIEAAPLYSGDDLTQLDSYGQSLLTNDEVIAVDQAGAPARPVDQRSPQQTWYTRNADGSYTVALFNLGSGPALVTAHWSDLGITGAAQVRDLWAHQNLGKMTGGFNANLPVHGSRLLRITPAPTSSPLVPLNVHGTASTATSLSLAWDPATGAAPVTGYQVYVDGTLALTTGGTQATITGLAPAATHQYTVVAYDSQGRTSVPSTPLSLTTSPTATPTVYQAEDPANSLAGGATVYGCACSGGAKVGFLGGSGTLTYTDISVPVSGTYLVQVAYVDGDSSRTGVFTVNGSPFQLPLPGTNDNDWNVPQTAVVPITLKAGTNTLQIGNPTDYVYDIDAITL